MQMSYLVSGQHQCQDLRFWHSSLTRQKRCHNIFSKCCASRCHNEQKVRRQSHVARARKSRPFSKISKPETQVSENGTEEEFESEIDGPPTEDEVLTQQYLDTLGKSEWAEDPLDHRSGYIAILGRPNAGKSTLMNALLGQKLSIVTPKAQTTRHKILSLINEADYQMILLDTPGIMATERNKLDSKMMKAVWQAARSADAVIGIIDVSANPKDALETIEQIFQSKEAKALPFAIVLNKVDLISGKDLAAATAWLNEKNLANIVIPTSARDGKGVQDVRQWAASQLPKGPSLYPKDVISEEPERFFIAEFVREQIFQQYYEEIPYCCTAHVTEYVSRPGAKHLVRVTIFVESDSQQAIIIGRQGNSLRKLSTASRIAIENFLEREIFLDLTIKVQKEWRSDERTVAGFGY